MTDNAVTDSTTAVNDAVAQGGAYEIIRQRLLEHGVQLVKKIDQLNQSREQEFGSTDMEVIGRVRVRTENNCVPRDIVRVGDYLLFAYNVYIGLKKETQIKDVFSLYELRRQDKKIEVHAVEQAKTFLDDSSFKKDFVELYAYYKHAQLIQVQVHNQKLLASFQIGETIGDIRVFRWNVQNDGQVSYIDDRGERDIQLPPAFDFEWQATQREDQITGQHPHVSILDEVFVETINGSLTIKIENNTEDGFGIYEEKVEDQHQSLDDAEIYYAKLGSLILLKIRPYRENDWRYLVFNALTNEAVRIDSIGETCILLPEDHGIIFPGGYYLQSGDTKLFDDDASGLRFVKKIRSPNGEDVLFSFYEAVEGRFALFSYNLIKKELAKPIYGHGYTFYEDGNALVFRSENTEPTRVHAMQVWKTPFCSEEYASQNRVSQSFFGKVGNSELVRGISDLYSISRSINEQKVSIPLYEELISQCQRVLNSYYWLASEETGYLESSLKEVSETAELVLDEFEKVASIQQQANTAIRESELELKKLIKEVHIENWNSPIQFVNALVKLRRQRGHLMSLREMRYIDLSRLGQLDELLENEQNSLSKKTVQFLDKADALSDYHITVQKLQDQIEKVSKVSELTPLLSELEELSQGVDALSELLGSLKIEDATQRTSILESISQVYAKLNQTKAHAKIKKKELGSGEAVAEFSAQFTLFSQSITSALGMADTPEKCEEQLSRLLIQLEEIEGQFSEYEEFLGDILSKREEVHEVFENRKQSLMQQRQKRSQTLGSAADRVIEGVQRRSLKFNTQDELNTYFSSDPMVLKIQDISQQLRDLDDSVRADDIEARLKSAKEQAIRSLRDKIDIFEDGGNTIKMGKHRFSVNTQNLDLTIVQKGEQQALHLIGTDYYEIIDHPELNELSQYWDQNIVSETSDVYRAEYLAASILHAARQGEHGLSMDKLMATTLSEGELYALVKEFAAPRYQEAYEKGVHDHDCVKILEKLLPALDIAGTLEFAPKIRAIAGVFWANYQIEKQKDLWLQQAKSAMQLSETLESSEAMSHLAFEIIGNLEMFVKENRLPFEQELLSSASDYLTQELANAEIGFVSSSEARNLANGLLDHLEKIGHKDQYEQAIQHLQGKICEQWLLTEAWLNGYVKFNSRTQFSRFIPEAITLLICAHNLDNYHTEFELDILVKQLMGDHPLINKQNLNLNVDQFLEKMHRYNNVVVPQYTKFQKIKQKISEQEKQKLRLEEFRPKPLASFVRNRLINEAYLPIIGDNLAKQMGTAGAAKRTDLMGMLLLISPPGYGKTTLMEYVANRLGLIFMKINCPSLGHDVHSLDPENAPNATARQELEKLNLALEMGNNVMLYLDDIQHTHPEFLQKFISLCDGTRRIEGVWKGNTQTYDMRGKKFCVVMAGNPYTESGELFKIPDMLANRADVYNLGDILSGQEDIFALSYIENTLTSNPVLAPLAVRDMDDVYLLIRMAQGENIPSTDLKHQYSGAELNEIINVLKKLFAIQNVILKVNQAYIASAASADKYRIEPSFKLQGSYRNMNKMAEKVVAIMDDKELDNLIGDHYVGEAQLLTTGAEENLLKLAELRGNMDDTQSARWDQIKKDYLRLKSIGGDDQDGTAKVVNQMSFITENLKAIEQALSKTDKGSDKEKVCVSEISKQLQAIKQSIETSTPDIQVVNQPVPGLEKSFAKLADIIDVTFMPVVSAMNHKINLDLNILKKVTDLSNDLKIFTSEQKKIGKPSVANKSVAKKNVAKKSVAKKGVTRKKEDK